MRSRASTTLMKMGPQEFTRFSFNMRYFPWILVASVVSIANGYLFSSLSRRSRPIGTVRTLTSRKVPPSQAGNQGFHNHMMTAAKISGELSVVGDDIEIMPPSLGKGMKTVMKFGGSSLANSERIMYVSKLIMKHFELGYKPVVVCSAMGKTTNSLLSAGDFALDGSVYIDSLRTLHTTTIKQLDLPDSTLVDIEKILTELRIYFKNVGSSLGGHQDSRQG